MKHINLVLLWHMHQPDYRHYDTREFEMPWVYLHAIKDYADMAFHLENHPKIKAVVNFVPILLDQIEDYASQFASGQIRDPLLRLLITPNLGDISDSDREFILTSCFKGNPDTMLKPYPAYERLFELKETGELIHFSERYFSDLLVWYHLAWTGESVRRNNEIIIQLMEKSTDYDYTDRTQLFSLIGQLVRDLIPRYRKLAETGQVELSTTPHYHPLAPLLIDFTSTHDSMPDAELPVSKDYPGGHERTAFHLSSAIDSHQRRFGSQPTGIWPAEGAISLPLIQMMGKSGCQWCASGEGVLANSLRKSYPDADLPDRNHYLYHPYRVHDSENITCFFRDDLLSDLIGFEYAKWHGRDAAEHLIQSLEQIGHDTQHDENPIVSIILDGENAWEHYPYNGFYFFDDLYSLLEQQTAIDTTTYSDYLTLTNQAEDVITLPALSAGSWVYGTFSTWIGDPDKNHAWDLLCAAKVCYDENIHNAHLSESEKEAASTQLASCESSDWFWWFGDYNQADAVIQFDQLYRDNLANLYRLLKLAVPKTVMEPISKGNADVRESGTMRRSS